MSCSLPVFACIQDISRVISILHDASLSGELDVKENVGRFTPDSSFCFCPGVPVHKS